MSKKSITSLIELLNHPNAGIFLHVIITRLSQVIEWPIHHFKVFYFEFDDTS